MGYQRPLEVNDIWLVNPNRSTEVMKKKLNHAFKKRRERNESRPLVKALFDTFKVEFLVGGACQLLSSSLQAVSPFVLRYLIQFATEAYVARGLGRPEPAIGRGLGLVFGISIMQICQTLATNHFMYRGMMVGGQARAVMIAIIFDKAMKISGRAKAGGVNLEVPPPNIKAGSEEERKWYEKILKRKRKEQSKSKQGATNDRQGWSNGRIINLMSTDTYRVDQASGMFHMVWTAPITILITLILLLVNITYSALSGFGLIVITMPLLGKAMRSMFRRRVLINKVTDQRVTLTQEILTAVRFVKFFGWELSFLERIGDIRKREIRSIQFLLSIRNGILSIGMSIPVFASMLAFITYSLSNHSLDPARVFSSLALFNSLRLPLNFLPMVLGQVIDALSSLSRIEEFLLAEEADENFDWDSRNKYAVTIRQADFTWERTSTQDNDEESGKSKRGKKASEDKHKENIKADKLDAEKKPFQIQGVDFDLGREELVAVIGTVGSGKTSLLAALAGDMRRTSGNVVMGASRAYCPQYAWIQNATVKQNIVFGREFNQEWYDQVIDACALRPDLEMLPNGDLTEIGERGITVSGGQKQRLNIARAIYFNADIVLLDDPLSAVDAHVGRHIMDNAICGLLEGKCRLLATHQLHVLHRCDRIIVMNEGRVQEIDTFPNLMAKSETFKRLMAATAMEEEEKNGEPGGIEDEEEDEQAKVKKESEKKSGPALMQAEERAVENVSWDVYLAYIKASGSTMVAPLVLTLLILSQGANIVTSLWLSWWTSNKFGYSEGEYVSHSFNLVARHTDEATDRCICCSRSDASFTHVPVLSLLVCFWHRSWKSHAKKGHQQSSSSTHVIF